MPKGQKKPMPKDKASSGNTFYNYLICNVFSYNKHNNIQILNKATITKLVCSNPVIETGTFADPQLRKLSCMLKQTNDKGHSKIIEHEHI